MPKAVKATNVRSRPPQRNRALEAIGLVDDVPKRQPRRASKPAETDPAAIPAFLRRSAHRPAVLEDTVEATSRPAKRAMPADLKWVSVFFPGGPYPTSEHRWSVKDPVVYGYGRVFLVPGEKRSTIFCPYSFTAWTVSNDCGEVATSRDLSGEFDPDWGVSLIDRKWREFHTQGMQVDYNTAALVMKRLGGKVLSGDDLPERATVDSFGHALNLPAKKEGPSGGKPVAPKLLRPVSKESKRGKILAFFIKAGKGTSQSVREAMAEFGSTRSNVLSVLYMLNKDHGIGYSLQDDAATIDLPKGKLWE